MIFPRVVVDGVPYTLEIAKGIVAGFDLSTQMLRDMQQSQSNESTAIMIGMMIAMIDQKKSKFQSGIIELLSRC